MASYEFTKTPVNCDRLEHEIQISTIAVALDNIILLASDQLTITFKADLSQAEQTELTGIVTAHTGEEYTEQIAILVTPTSPKNDYDSKRQGSMIRKFMADDYCAAITLSNKNGLTYTFSSTLTPGEEDVVFFWDVDGYFVRAFIEEVDGMHQQR